MCLRRPCALIQIIPCAEKTFGSCACGARSVEFVKADAPTEVDNLRSTSSFAD